MVKAWSMDEGNRAKVLKMYRSPSIPTAAAIAAELKTHPQYVLRVLKDCMPEAERKALAVLRYSASKAGAKNPMTGKIEAQHHNWKGDCDDGHGYLTRVWRGKRRFVHHIVMMEALGARALPVGMDVHHIDGNPKNNALDNLALVTKRGHKTIHYLQAKDSLDVALKKSSLAEALKYMTSQ